MKRAYKKIALFSNGTTGTIGGCSCMCREHVDSHPLGSVLIIISIDTKIRIRPETGLKKCLFVFDLGGLSMFSKQSAGVIAAGLALFSMFFGAGDLIWPLLSGDDRAIKTFQP